MNKFFIITLLFLIGGCATEQEPCLKDALASSEIKSLDSAKTLCLMKSMHSDGALSDKEYQEKVYALIAIDNSGGNGDSPDSAIVLHNAKTLNECLRFEYLYLSIKYPDYRSLTISPSSNKQSFYNVVTIANTENSRALYFNTSHCHGK